VKVALFIIIYFLTTLWLQIKLTLSTLEQRKIFEPVKDENLLNLIFEKTGLKLSAIQIFNSPIFFAMMGSFLSKPVMILSKKLYENFSEKELEYVIFHETGHYLLAHNLKEILIGISLSVLGSVFILTFSVNFFVSFLLALIFGIFAIQLFRGFEYQADKFALKALGTPTAMISATKKFVKGNNAKLINRGLGRIFKLLFVRTVPYWERVKIAEEFIFKK